MKNEVLKVHKMPRVNFRPLLFCALGLLFGIFPYISFRFGEFRLSDFLFPAVFFALALIPFEKKRILAVLLSLFLFAGAGVGLIHWQISRYTSGMVGGEYVISGTVRSFRAYSGYTRVVLGDLTIGGKKADGMLECYIPSEEIRPGDILLTEAVVERGDPAAFESYERGYYLSEDIRYLSGNVSSWQKTGVSRDPFLLLKSRVYGLLHGTLERDEADVAYALLFGESRMLDSSLSERVRKGGIAHIFAISGLHIGILFGAVQLLCRRLKKYAFLPAFGAGFLYCALCGFPVSAIRALIMSTAVGIWSAYGRKTDFLNSISLAALLVLLFVPSEWESTGFRLSFGACLGLALFAPALARGMKKLPRFFSQYLSAAIAVQLFTFPVLLESFGYISLWGYVLNFFLIPLLPFLFLGLILSTAAALVLPFAVSFFLAFPHAVLALLLALLALDPLSAVLTGFSLGAGATVWLLGCFLLSDRVRMKAAVRTGLGAALLFVFLVTLVVRNVVGFGCMLIPYSSKRGEALLVRSGGENVLVLGDCSLADCKEFVMRNFGGKLSAVITLPAYPRDLNTAAFLGAEEIRTRRATDTGLHESKILYGDSFSYGELEFEYLSDRELLLRTEGVAVEIEFGGKDDWGCDLFPAGTQKLYRLFRGSYTVWTP